MSKPNAQQQSFRDGTVSTVTPKVVLSGFEQLSKAIPEDQWLNTPALVEYVRANFETRYCPEQMIAALDLKFHDSDLNMDFLSQRPTKLLEGITESPAVEELPEEEEISA